MTRELKHHATSARALARRAAYSVAACASTAAVSDPAARADIQYFTGDIDIPQLTSQPLDFNLDSYADIVLKNYILPGGNYQGATVGFYPGKIVGFFDGLYYVTALAEGDLIDSSALGPTFYGSMAYGALNPNAGFNDATDAYVGFAFPIGPTDLYYAWVRVDINQAAGTFFVHDWAYEDQTGVGIRAGDRGVVPVLGDFDEDQDVDGADFLQWQRGSGSIYNASDLQDWQDNYGTIPAAAASAGVVPEPGTLGLLAAGAAGVAWMRRRRTAS
ncbi:MAG: hypothetical protein CMJ58_04355 [Planctomycetaceae bacterium]|nr:hypothetical protein [Planctomycetaceae bacterium]